MPTISILIPAYNEEATIIPLLERVRENPVDGFEFEVIVINDGSTDDTLALLKSRPELYAKLVNQERNSGKGSALQAGLAASSGDYVLFQDADLEYDPADYAKLCAPFMESDADVVFGSRFRTGDSVRVLYFWHSLGNRFLTLLSNVFTDLNLTDMECCYKMFRRDVLQRVTLKERRFGIEPEVTARVSHLKPRPRIFEVGISYRGRTYQEGKKIGWKDGIRAIYCILRYNLIR